MKRTLLILALVLLTIVSVGCATVKAQSQEITTTPTPIYITGDGIEPNTLVQGSCGPGYFKYVNEMSFDIDAIGEKVTITLVPMRYSLFGFPVGTLYAWDPYAQTYYVYQAK